MKIQKVEIKNFKVIKDLEKEINGSNIILLGDNEVGKSSFIQAIKLALGMIKDAPLETDTEIKVITDKNGDKYQFKVTEKNGKAVIEVLTQEGLRDTRKSVLTGLTGGIEFDIEEFVKLSESKAGQKKQVEIFKSLLPVDVIEDLNNLQHKVNLDYDDRTENNKVIKTIEGFIAESGLSSEDFETYKELIDVSELRTKIREAQDLNSEIRSVSERYENRKIDIQDLERQLKEAKEKQKLAESFLNKNKEIDTTKLDDELTKAYDHNSKAEKVKTFQSKQTELIEHREISDKLTGEIDSNRKTLSDTIKQIDSPVDGLMFNDEVLEYNGVEVKEGCLAESQIMELGIKMKLAQNPDLEVLMIENGQSLGLKKLQNIQSMGYQIIMEQVERGTDELKIEIMPTY